jgi:hypothetical protein
VRHAGGKDAERHHPLGERALRLELLALGDVAAGDEDGGLALVLHGLRRRELEHGDHAVGAEVADLHRGGEASSAVDDADPLAHARAVVGVDDLEHVAADEVLGAAVTERGGAGAVHVDEARAAADGDQVGHLLDELAEVLLGAAERFLGAAELLLGGGRRPRRAHGCKRTRSGSLGETRPR